MAGFCCPWPLGNIIFVGYIHPHSSYQRSLCVQPHGHMEVVTQRSTGSTDDDNHSVDLLYDTLVT